MKVIISAIACAPGEGSEGGVGWRAVQRIAREHDVRVITQEMNRPSWERAEREGTVPRSVRVRYVDCGTGWHPNRMIARIQSWTRYLKFSREVLDMAKAWHDEEPADLVHQVTYATWRVPSPLWQMPVPFVWGPVGGTAMFPKQFLGTLGKAARAFEMVREVQGSLAARSSAFIRCVENSAVVLAANGETSMFLKPYRRGRPLLELPVAYMTRNEVEVFSKPLVEKESARGPLKLFAGGNIEGRKGVSMALRAIHRLKQQGIRVEYTVAGGGPEIPTLRKLASRLGIDELVHFHPGYRGRDYVRKLQESDVYFLPSFRETNPVTLLEASLAGCVPVVAGASGSGEMARMIGGDAIPAASPDALIDGLAAAVMRLHHDRGELKRRSCAVSKSAADLYSEIRYDEIIGRAYEVAVQGVHKDGVIAS